VQLSLLLFTLSRSPNYFCNHPVCRSGTQTPEFIIDRCEGTPAALFDFLFENYLDFMPDADLDCSAAAAEADSSSSSSSAFSVVDIGNESLTAFETLSEAISSADMMRCAANTDYSNVRLVINLSGRHEE
jgi:hypothetical protein